MNRHYQSDLDDDEPEDPPIDWRDAIDRAMVAIAVLAALTWISVAVYADETGDGPCVPTVSDYDSAYAFGDGDYVVIWWCEEQTSLASYWWTDTTQKSNPAAVLRLAGRDPDEFRRQLEHRWSTVEQISLAMQTQQQYGPRCYSGNLQVSCNSWRTVNGRLMCEVSGMIQADATRLPADSWMPCVVTKAPVGGWQ